MAEESDRLEPTKGDWAHTVARMGLSAIPIVGGPAVELLNVVITPPLARRRDDWLLSIAAGLKDLEQKVDGLRPESLRTNPTFISVMLQASHVALRSHQKEKLEALRNAVLNTASGVGIEEDLQAIFLSLIDVFTPWHLRIMTVLYEAERFFPQDHNSMPQLPGESIGVFGLVKRAYPELGLTHHEHYEFFDQIGEELKARGLIPRFSFPLTKTKQGGVLIHSLEQRLTAMGIQFMKYISDPRG